MGSGVSTPFAGRVVVDSWAVVADARAVLVVVLRRVLVVVVLVTVLLVRVVASPVLVRVVLVERLSQVEGRDGASTQYEFPGASTSHFSGRDGFFVTKVESASCVFEVPDHQCIQQGY